MSTQSSNEWQSLREMLEERLGIIANHELRDRDAAAHLELLMNVSQRLQAEHERLRGTLPPRLNHYLTQASYSKALEWINGMESGH